MVTEFGKFLRKLRIDRGELLADMAQKLEVSASFLSAVETGTKNMPHAWPSQIIDLYSLSKEQAVALRKAADVSVKQIRIQLDDIQNEKRDLVITFARLFNDLGCNEVESIMRILKRRSSESTAQAS